MTFRLVATCPTTGARAGMVKTAHGELPTPAFMPVGTRASVKGLTPGDLLGLSAHCVLANTYHLALRPGAELVARLGGIQRFMGWSRAVLTDSGGFQVWSLAGLRETTERGVHFRSHLDGEPLELTPEGVVRTQELLGSDIAMPLDVCLGADAARSEAADAAERTRRWAARSATAHRRSDQLLFGIVQGGLDVRLRQETARDLQSLDFPGYAIGGLSVGEPLELTEKLVSVTTAELPVDRPRYLMGVGTPEQVLAYSALGVDMFDCVLPTRLGRTGVAFGPGGRLNLKRAAFRADGDPVDPTCDCRTCGRFGRAALHAMLRDAGPLAARLISVHNCRALVRTAEAVRSAVLEGRFPRLLGEARTSEQAAGSDRAARRAAEWRRPAAVAAG